MRNSSRTRPLPWLTILVITPRRVPACAMTTPWNSSGTSMTRSSTGSIFTPSISLVTMSGRDTCSSKPSRRIISIRIDSCSSPRPITFICSGVSVSSTRSDTLPSSSRGEPIAQVARRDVLAVAAGHRRRVDAEDHRHGRLVDRDRRNGARGAPGSAIVSPIVMSSMPARQTMSPAAASLDLDALQAVEREQLGDLRLLDAAVELEHRHRVVQLDRAVEDAADGDAAEVVARVEIGDEHLQRRRRDCRAAAARARRSRRTAAAGPRPRSPGSALATPSRAFV